MNELTFRARKGATFIEYALLAGLVAIVVAAAAMFFGDDLRELFSSESAQTKSVTEGVNKVKLGAGLDHASQDNSSQSGGQSGGTN